MMVVRFTHQEYRISLRRSKEAISLNSLMLKKNSETSSLLLLIAYPRGKCGVTALRSLAANGSIV